MFSFSLFAFIIFVAIEAELIVARRSVWSRDWPQHEQEYEILDEPKSEWNCNFERNDCGIVNDAIVGQYFQLTSAQLGPRTGKRSMLLLNITRIGSHPSGARLITPYFQRKHHSKGCLTIDYMMHGNGIKNLAIYQQDTDNRCIWEDRIDLIEPPQVWDWKQLSVNVDLQYGDPRFFIETHFDNRRNTGFVAISAINFFHNPCKQNDAKQCSVPGRTDNEDSTAPSTDDEDYPNDLP